MICPTGIAEYFSREDWTTQITLIRLNKSSVSRNGFASSRTHKSGLVGAVCSMSRYAATARCCAQASSTKGLRFIFV